jgi:broad specificity phosphatase PhoE
MEKQVLVFVARHGVTDLNKRDAFRGPIDAPLDKSGVRDAHQLAHYFEPVDLSYIIHSDKKRTRETAKTIGDRKLMDIFPNEELRAWNVGDLGGKPKDEDNLAIVEHHVQNPDLPFPGGESLNEFRNRVRPILAQAIDKGEEIGIPLLLVAHSSVIHEIGTMLSGNHDYTLVEPGGVCAIYVGNGKLDAEPIFKARKKPTTQVGENLT